MPIDARGRSRTDFSHECPGEPASVPPESQTAELGRGTDSYLLHEPPTIDASQPFVGASSRLVERDPRIAMHLLREVHVAKLVPLAAEGLSGDREPIPQQRLRDVRKIVMSREPEPEFVVLGV